MKAVIMAGGLGTRLCSAEKGLPKPMLHVAGKPVLERQIECLVRYGVTDITIVTGFLGGTIEQYFGQGERLGADISYYHESEPLGTGGALLKIKHDSGFLVINGDVVFDVDIGRFVAYHNDKHALATLLTHPSTHPGDSALIEADSDGRVISWLPKNRLPADHKNLTNAGLHILSPELLEGCVTRGKASLDSDILVPAVDTRRVFSYKTFEYVRDMGTPERLAQVSADVLSGLPEVKNRSKKQRAVFLDRDGTLNVYNGLITSPEQLILADGAARAVKIINDLGFLAVVVTNQPVVARGLCTFEQLDAIHNRLETLLGAQGAYLDAVYFCPHHPDGGFEGEVPALKINCSCRKPKPGMLLKAAAELNISLNDSYMVGDSVTDVLCGRAAGCKTAFLKCGRNDIPPEGTPVFNNLLSYAEYLSEKI